MLEFKYKRNKKLIFLCFLIAGMIILGLYLPYFNLLAIAIFGYSIFKVNEEDTLCIMLFMLSFSPIFKLKIGGFTLFNLAILLVIIKMLIYQRFVLPSKGGILLIIFSFYIVFTSFYINIVECITVICSLLLAMMLYRPEKKKYDLKKVTVFTTWGVLITSVLAIFGKNIPKIALLLDKATIRISAGTYYYRFSGLMENPNYYTMLPSLLLAAIVILIIKKKSDFMDYLYFVGLAIFGFMSLSQSFILTFIIMLLLILVISTYKSPKSLIIMLFTFIGLFIVVYKLLDKNTIDTILFRLQSNQSNSENLGALTSGRTELWKFYIEYIFSDIKILFLGAGIGAGNLWVGASHNYYIDMLYYLGIIGTVLYLCCIFSIIKIKRYCKKKPKVYQYLPLIIFLIRAFARNLLLSEQLIYMFIFCSIAICEGNTVLELKNTNYIKLKKVKI